MSNEYSFFRSSLCRPTLRVPPDTKQECIRNSTDVVGRCDLSRNANRTRFTVLEIPQDRKEEPLTDLEKNAVSLKLTTARARREDCRCTRRARYFSTRFPFAFSFANSLLVLASFYAMIKIYYSNKFI